jgi:hypothetical protein
VISAEERDQQRISNARLYGRDRDFSAVHSRGISAANNITSRLATRSHAGHRTAAANHIALEMSRVRLASQWAFVRERPRRVAVERMSKASILAVVNGRHLVDDLQTIRGQWHRRSPPAATRPCVHRVADLLIKRPVVNAQQVSDQLNVAIDNVYR